MDSFLVLLKLSALVLFTKRCAIWQATTKLELKLRLRIQDENLVLESIFWSPGKKADYTRDREIKKDCRGEIRQKSGQEPSKIKGSKWD